MRAVIVCMVVAMAGNAMAQPGITPPSPPPPSSPPPSAPAVSVPSAPKDAPAQPRAGEVREDTAVMLGLGATAASWTVLIIGLKNDSGPAALTGMLGAAILPSVGNWYAGSSGGVWLGMRVVGFAGMIYGLLSIAGSECDEGCSDGGVEGPALLLGAALVITGTITDIATAPSAARRHNRELPRLTVAPMVHHGGGGLVVGGRF